MANVILSISARNRTRRPLEEIRKSVEGVIRTNMRGSFESERSFSMLIRSTKVYLREQERARDAYIKFWQDGLRAQERAEAAEARSKRIERAREFNRVLRDSTFISEQAARAFANDFQDVEGALSRSLRAYQRQQTEIERVRAAQIRLQQTGDRNRLAERQREFNRILRDSTIISERAAREIANDYSDIEGALTKSLRAYQRQQKEIERMSRAQDRARTSFRSLFQTVADGTFIFREFSFIVQGVGRDLVQTSIYMDSVRRSLAIFAKEGESAQDILDDVFALAREPGVTIAGASKAVQDLKAINVETELVNRSIREFGNLLALTGETDFSGLLLGFKQIINRQRVSQEELNQIIERSGLAAQALQNAFGFATSEEIQGVVDARGGNIIENFVRPFLAELEKLERFPIDAPATQFKNLANEAFRLKAAIGDELLPELSRLAKITTDFLRDGGIERITGGFRFLQDAIGPALAGVATFAGARGLGTLIARAKESGLTLGALASRARTSLTSFASAYGPALAATAAVTTATALWTQTLEENRRARELGRQVNEDYAASLRNITSALESGQTDAKVFGQILENIDRQIAEYSQQRADVGGIFSDLNPFDNRAIREQLSSLDELTTNAEQLRTVVQGLQRGTINREQGIQQLLGFSTEGLEEIGGELQTLEKDIAVFQNALNQIGTPADVRRFRELFDGATPSTGTARGILDERIEQSRVQIRFLEAERTSLQNILNLLQNINKEQVTRTATTRGETGTDLSIAIAREEDTLRRLRESLSGAAAGDIQGIHTQTQQSLSRLTELRRRYARLTIDDADKLRLRLVELELSSLREIDGIATAARNRRKSLRETEAKERIALETNTQKAIARSVLAENKRQADALKVFLDERRTLSESEAERLDGMVGALVRQGRAFDVAYQQASRFFQLTNAVSAIPERFDAGVTRLNIGLARLKVLIQDASTAAREAFSRELPDIFERAGVNVERGPSFEDFVQRRGSTAPSIEEDQANVGRAGRSFVLEAFNEESRQTLAEQQQTVTRIVNQTQQAIVDIISSSGDSFVENLQRVVKSFVASSVSMIAQSKVQYEIQRYYDNKLTQEKLANLARLQAATASRSVLGTIGSAGTGVLSGNPLALLGALPNIVNLIQIGDNDVREISSVQRQQRAERTDF